MKAKKLMGMIACASACVSLSAFANTTNAWFSASATGSGTNLENVAISGDCTVADSKFNLDNEFSSRLVFTPDAAFTSTNMSDGVVKITATAVLTPSDASDLSTENLAEAKAGLAVGVSNNGVDTNFYGFAGASGSQAWTKLTGTPPADGETTFTIILDYRTHKVQFVVGDAVLAAATGGATLFDFATGTDSLVSIDAFGSGSISTLNSGYEVAVAAVSGGNKYGSATEAVIAAGTSGTVLDIDPTTGNATSTKQADNGLYAWECEILGIAGNAAIPLQPATKEVAADKIAVAVSGYTPVDGVSVKFQVKQGESVFETKYDADAIGIPMTTGQYTVVPEIKATASN